MMSIYKSPTSKIDGFALYLRRQGYTAYVEQDDNGTYLITDYNVTGSSFRFIGYRSF